MIAKLTGEQIAAIDLLSPGEDLELVDDANQKTYILFDKEAYEAWVDGKLQEAFDAIDRGEVEPWDLEKMKRECLERRLRKAERVMLEIIETQRAKEDMIEIWEYISRDKEAAADQFLERIHERFVQLAQNPAIGEVFKRMPRQIRRITIGNYVIYYHSMPDTVYILRVLHGARRPKGLI